MMVIIIVPSLTLASLKLNFSEIKIVHRNVAAERNNNQRLFYFFSLFSSINILVRVQNFFHIFRLLLMSAEMNF